MHPPVRFPYGGHDLPQVRREVGVLALHVPPRAVGQYHAPTDGTLLQTHRSHAKRKTISPGRFRAILRYQLGVTEEEFWRVLEGRGKKAAVERRSPWDVRS